MILLLTSCVSSKQLVSNTRRKNEFSGGHINICGLINKVDSLSLFIANIDNNFNAFGVNETFLEDSIPTELVSIRGYVFERTDRLNT